MAKDLTGLHAHLESGSEIRGSDLFMDIEYYEGACKHHGTHLFEVLQFFCNVVWQTGEAVPSLFRVFLLNVLDAVFMLTRNYLTYL